MRKKGFEPSQALSHMVSLKKAHDIKGCYSQELLLLSHARLTTPALPRKGAFTYIIKITTYLLYKKFYKPL